MLCIFALAISLSVTVGIMRIYDSALSDLSARLNNTYGIRTSAIANMTSAAFSEVPSIDIAVIVVVVSVVILIFGIAIAVIALRPTRDALASQKQFIGNVAHELRTPLSIVKTNIEVALMDERLDNELRRALTDNVEELDRSSDIINNLLSLNTLLNPAEIPFADVDLGAVADEAIERLRPLAQKRGVGLTVARGEFLLARGNYTALVQVATNLIKNALTHTPVRGEVSVIIQPDYRGYIELAVADTGEGIAQEDLFHIFEPFYQSDTSRSKKHGGSGLGLTIVSEIVKLHRGKVVMKSKEQRGTTVIVSIPCGTSEDDRLPDPSEHADEIAMDFTKERPSKPHHT